ncbi:hypothetical protein DACRYDRAFT_113659 [Dacryopinax primogenitus]|uniref:DAGKc domain-containing protein n=1 Tax=Dacryopinax primogenitus (strain DJM 731) TaxID=1858805 RepID=M5GEP5_DACPD|nr:uncharacterized protein DACRYDRAFT_113659 [Dacryopinax primogenitus]EJU05582.1 hypothetical protein DACRYDRAFT_113659 [Dacryopinax primogenitus]
MSSPVLIISNPSSGDRTGPQFLAAHVLPLLDAHSISYSIQTTTRPEHAGELALAFLSSLAADGAATIIIAGGDGTLHEVVNALHPSGEKSNGPKDIRFVLLPLGTANALYHSYFPPSLRFKAEDYPQLSSVPVDIQPKLLSLACFLGGSTGKCHRLTLACTTFYPGPNGLKAPEPVISCVVTSTALHAAILHDAESLRTQYPGVERFKHAAERNISKWYEARAWVLPLPGGKVQLYDPTLGEFADLDVDKEEETEYDEPFAYFLSTVNVDRLEAAFRIAPLQRSHPPRDPSMDLLLIRPKRDPGFGKDLTGARAAFGGKVFRVMYGAYGDGAHVGYRYDGEGEVGEGGEGRTVVEYFRCGGWEWEPEGVDENAHLVCADGTIVKIPEGGKAVWNLRPRARTLASTVLLSRSAADWRTEPVSKLKDELRKRGLALSGNKGALVTRLVQADHARELASLSSSRDAAALVVPPAPPLPTTLTPSPRTVATTARVRATESLERDKFSPRPFAYAFQLPPAEPDHEEPGPNIPYLADSWGSQAFESASPPQPPESSEPKVLTVASVSTHLSGGPISNLFEISDRPDMGSSSSAGIQSASQRAVSHASGLLESVGEAVGGWGFPSDVLGLPEVKEENNKKERMREMSREEAGGLWAVGGILAGGWLLGAIFTPKKVEHEGKH